MAIPTLIAELSTTASSNAPAGSDSPSTLDDIQRAHGSFIAQLRDRTATDWPNTPAGNIAATNVQAAINELDSEKVSLTGNETIAGTKTFSSAPVVPGLSDSGNLTFTGTGNRITGDFSNATHSNRVAIQTSVVNGATVPFIIPNGTSTSASVVLANASDPTNSSYLQLITTATDVAIKADKLGTGTHLPMTFYTGGAERMRIDTSGNVGVGTASPSNYGKFAIAGAGTTAATYSFVTTDASGASNFAVRDDGLVTANKPAGLGYGTGSGGSVTQATSKATAVTLNRPTGAITMNNATLGAGASAIFALNNTLITTSDTLITNAAGNPNYRAECLTVAGGSANLRVTNISAGSLSDAVQINFAIIKGATS